MSNPMTTEEVEKKHGAHSTEDGTCSVICKFCNGRVWFTGNSQDQNRSYTCPYCEHYQYNKILGWRKSRC